MDRKLDGSSVEFDRGFVGLLAFGTGAVSVSELGAHASVLRSEVIWSWVVGYSG